MAKILDETEVAALRERFVTTPDEEQMRAECDRYRIPESAREEIYREVRLSRAMQEAAFKAAMAIVQGEDVSFDAFAQETAAIAEAQGFDMGIPFPDFDMGNPFISAKGTPLGGALQYNTLMAETELAGELQARGHRVRSSWEMLGDRTVAIVEDETGRLRVETSPHAGIRMRKSMNTALTRGGLPNLTAEAELRAMESLKTKLTPNQWNSYVLSGIFPERSKRSDLHYIFRKGLPTMVLSYHGNDFIKKSGRIIACLCLHPYGYYQGTHCGAMTPTDEVMAHLLLMRADEHTFWKKSGQWQATDPRSGL